MQAIVGHSVERNAYNDLYAAGTTYPDDDILIDLGSAAKRSKISSNYTAS